MKRDWRFKMLDILERAMICTLGSQGEWLRANLSPETRQQRIMVLRDLYKIQHYILRTAFTKEVK